MKPPGTFPNVGARGVVSSDDDFEAGEIWELQKMLHN